MKPDIQTIKDRLLSGSLSIHELREHQDKKAEIFQTFTTSRVYSLCDENKNIIGYYKEEKYGHFGAVLMNQIAYETASILGIEKKLIPSMKIQPFSTNKKSFKGGSIQLAQEGISLDMYLNHPNKRTSTIVQDEYIDALFISIVLGMFDAHLKNILIDPNGRIIFFDLTRSLPHANTFLDRGGYLSYSYKCLLLFMKNQASILSLEKQKELHKKLVHLEKRLENVRDYLRSNTVKAHIKELPPYWFSPSKAFNALEQRLFNLRTGLENHQIHQARDLAFVAFPQYRFICLLNFCMLLDWKAQVKNEYLLNRCLRDIELSAFYDLIPAPIEGMIDECIKLDLDPCIIQECSKKDTLTQSMSCIVHEFKKSLTNPKTGTDKKHLSLQGEILKNKLKNLAEIDYKDWGENYPEEDFFNS